ncbi:MAG: hypothetical protein COA79_22930 [Planctomycetota bacterium]|nr:MAG: hypothetical protein COA79_22930 [Planctomycetota bacterium]
MSGYVLWTNKIDPKANSVHALKKFDDIDLLDEGESLIKSFPKSAFFQLRTNFDKFIDNMNNVSSLIVISEGLMKFLETRDISNVEMIPIKIKDIKGKSIKEKYFIVNVLDHQDCLDHEASGAKYSQVLDYIVEKVKKYIFKKGKLNKKLDIFKVEDFPYHTFVSSSLAKEIDSKGFTGIKWKKATITNI